MYRKISTIATLALSGLLVLLASPVAASAGAYTTEESQGLCGYSFTAWDTAMGGTQVAARDSVVNASQVKLRLFDDNEAAGAGTSAEIGNLGLSVQTGDVLSVDYSLSHGASPDLGAARLFVYMAPDADTWSLVPDYVATADSTSGTLSILFTSDGTIGTAGVVYDTSGGNFGKATYSNLQLNDTSVPFIGADCPVRIRYVTAPSINQPAVCDGIATLNVPTQEGVQYFAKLGGVWLPVQSGGDIELNPGWLWVKAEPMVGYYFKNGHQVWKLKVKPADICPPESPSPSPEPSEGPTPTPTESASPTPSVVPSVTPTAGPGLVPTGTQTNTGGNLAQTGSPTMWLVTAGFALGAVGAAIVWFTRRSNAVRRGAANADI